MRVLGVDTVSPHPSLALVGAGDVPLERALPRSAAETLPGETAALLSAAGVARTSLERVAVVSGPGSFTGLRAGVAFARGLARALGVPLVLVPTFEAASEAAGRGAELDFVLDAGRGEVYLGRRREGRLSGLPERVPRSALATGVPAVDLDSAPLPLARAAAVIASAADALPEGSIVYGRRSSAEERFGP